MNEGAQRLTVELTQTPGIEGAILTINAKNGEIVSMVGGYDFTTQQIQ